MDLHWNKIICDGAEINLEVTLGGGQSFRWHQTGEPGEWRGVLCGLVWTLKLDDKGNICYAVNDASDQTGKVKHYEDILRDYLRLNINLKEQYTKWSIADPNFKKVSKEFPGIRILRQDPLENLMSFICSSNNNITRITSMVESLCSSFGVEIFHDNERRYHKFPVLEVLAETGTEEQLRQLSFGYRARYIHQAAQQLLSEGGTEWLLSLREMPYAEAHAALTRLPGVGAKVADCVCLMSLDKLEAIPVDTHIWQVTKRDYLPQLKDVKSVTKNNYLQIGEFYRKRFGKYAGWANTVLFAADLKKFKANTHIEKKKKKRPLEKTKK